MSESRNEFEAYWRARQLRTHRYTDRPYPDDWRLAFKADAEAAWQASRRAALEEAAKVCKDLLESYDTGGDPSVGMGFSDAIEAAVAAIRELAGKTKEGQEP